MLRLRLVVPDPKPT